MKWFIAILILVLAALPVSACSGYGAGFGIGYSYAPQASFAYAAPQFYVQPPVQAEITYSLPAQPPPQVTTTTTTYSYQAPLSTVIQYGAPLYAPTQPYFANFPVGYSGGYSSAFAYNRGFINRGFQQNHHHHHNGNNNVGRNAIIVNGRVIRR